MVKNRHVAAEALVEEVRYTPPGSGAAGVEVMTIAELRRRMDHHGTSDTARGTGPAQRPDFHLLLTVESGLLRHMVDFADYAVGDGAWLWVRPGQVQRFGDLHAASGRLVLFQPDFLEAATASCVLDDAFGPTLWPVAGEQGTAMRRALRHLAAEAASETLPAATRSAILQRLLAVLLLRLTSLSVRAGAVPEEHAETFRRFRSAVESEYARARDVGHYARGLGYSPRTLTRAALAASGVGAKEFIDRRVVLEAKRLLAHADEPVSGVAARLGFLDASNFVKYFAQRTGTTPAAFRTRFRSGLAAP